MKRVVASTLTYDASVGRIEPGETYIVEDDKAERWITAGVATEAPPQPPAPDPQPIPPTPTAEPEEDGDAEEDDVAEDKDPEQLAAEARAFHAAGDSERVIAQKLGISRTRVHNLLTN